MIFKRKTYSYPDMVTMSFRTSPFYSAIFTIENIISALMPTATIFITAYFIDTAIAMFNGYAVVTDMYLPVVLIVANMLYNSLIGAVMSFVGARRQVYYREKVGTEMLNYRASMAYHHIEDRDSHDLIWRVFPYVENTIWDMFRQIRNVMWLIIFAGGILATLFTQVWWIAVTMLIFSVPVIYMGKKAGEEDYQAERDMTEVNRKYWNLGWVLNNRENVEERTIYGYAENINQRWLDKYEFSRKFRQKVQIKNLAKGIGSNTFANLYAIGVMAALLSQTYAGVLTIGMFIGLIGAVLNVSVQLSWYVNWHMQQIVRSREWLRDLTKFMAFDLQEGATDAPEPMKFKRIEFRNVTFSYPKMEKLILDGVSFVIEYGKHYSFVGENGAGKTTITKLITGLYDNYTGEILVDGVNLRDLTHAQLKGLTSVVYQDFAKYSFSMYDNIAIGDINSYGNRDKVNDAAKLADLTQTISELPQGIDTPLGKVLKDGVDISGGQWQRTAMARSVMNPAPLKILDEPTSALDPIAESELYKNFEAITRGETTIFISHRLGSCKLADVIYVLDCGKIVEEGAHDTLIAGAGLYAKMYNAQADWYKDELEANHV